MNSSDGCRSKQKQIAIIGFSARAASQVAKRQGFEVIAIDQCADRDLLTECSFHLRLDYPNWPAVLNETYPSVPLLLTGGMEHRTKLLAQCQRVAKRCGPTGPQITSMRNLSNWENWAGCSEIAWPTTIRDTQDVPRTITSAPNRTWIMKSMESAGGTNIVEICNDFELRNPCLFQDKNTYFQERQSGESIGVTFLSSKFGCAVVGASAAWPIVSHAKTGKYIYRGSFGPIAIPELLIRRLQRFGSIASIKSGLLGLWQADFLLDRENLTLLEINPRWSASMELLDVGLNLPLVEMHHDSVCSMLNQWSFAEFAACCIDQLMTESVRKVAKLIVYAIDPMVVTQAQSDHWLNHRWKCSFPAVDQQHFFADIPFAGTAISKGDPILTVLTTGDSATSLLEVLEKAKATIVVP